MDGQQQFGNKKNKKIDDEVPISKKALRNQQKNLNKSLANQKLIQQLQFKKNGSQKSNETTSSTKKKLDPKVQKKVNDIKAILEHHKEETILKVLQKHNYDQQQALQELFNMPMDEVAQQKTEWSNQTAEWEQKKQSKNKQSKQEMANEILNEIYDNKEQIDPSQFEQLFAEITDIIKEQQKRNGMDLFEINQFIDDCYLIKNVILEDQTEIYIHQDDELARQTQLFMEELIKKRVTLQMKRQEDFPTLGSVNKSKAGQKSAIQKIQDQYRQQKIQQQYFTPNKVPQVHGHHYKESQQYSVYSLNNNPRSHADILQLSKEYNDMGIDKLKFIYLRLEDINLCKTFLERYYADKKREIKVEKVEDRKNNSSNFKKVQKASYKRLEDANFKNYSLSQIRQQLDHLFKLRGVFRITRGKTTNQAYRKELERLARRDDPRIQKLCEVARFKVIENMVKSNPQFIDLHGYREQEIDELFNEIQDMIRLQFKKGNPRLETTKSGNNVYCVVRALTGKGLHSRSNKSVLKPTLLEWCHRNGVKSTQTQDTINVFIQVR